MPALQRPRRCLLLSYAFLPGLGGIENVSRVVAESLAARGYDVRVLTMTPGGSGEGDVHAGGYGGSYGVIRDPGQFDLLRQLRWSDVVLQSNLSLRLAWPLAYFAYPRPWVVVHHTPLTRPSGAVSSRDRLKWWSLRRASCYSVSKYLASTIRVPSEVLPNPYDDEQFRLMDDVQRDQPLIFVGRLVPAKGLDTLLEALVILRSQSFRPRLTVVGAGPDQHSLQQLARSSGLGEQVRFVGRRDGADLARLLNAHQVLVAPSRPSPPEALPLVPLEAIACGCAVIGADQGGLPESMGPCGVTFKSESAPELAVRIRELLVHPERRAELLSQRAGFLQRFTRQAAMDQYEAAILRAANSPQHGRSVN